MEGKTYKAIATLKNKRRNKLIVKRRRRIEEKRNKTKQIKKVFDLDELKQAV